MKEALAEAQKALALGEVPIGCVIVREGKIIGRGHNCCTTGKSPLLHAEIAAIHEAAGDVGDWRLEGCRLYVTIEPCPMCAGAIVQARIPYVFFGAKNPKAGCAGSIVNLLEEPSFNHQAEVVFGILEGDCRALMQSFFRCLRSGESKPSSLTKG